MREKEGGGCLRSRPLFLGCAVPLGASSVPPGWALTSPVCWAVTGSCVCGAHAARVASRPTDAAEAPNGGGAPTGRPTRFFTLSRSALTSPPSPNQPSSPKTTPRQATRAVKGPRAEEAARAGEAGARRRLRLRRRRLLRALVRSREKERIRNERPPFFACETNPSSSSVIHIR